MSKKIVITSETQGKFNQRADNEHGLQRSIRTGEIGHNQFFDDTGHLSKLGASAARIASGESAWPASDEM